MVSVITEAAELPFDDNAPTAELPAISQSPTTGIVPTATLIERAALRSFQAEQRLPHTIALHPPRLLTIPISQWECYQFRGQPIELRALTFVECTHIGIHADDAMICE